jgi:hypothetical protein
MNKFKEFLIICFRFSEGKLKAPLASLILKGAINPIKIHQHIILKLSLLLNNQSRFQIN